MTAREFGQAIKTHRQRLGLTQEQLAAKIGCKPCQVTAWELARRLPKVQDLWAMVRIFDSHAFDLSLEAFLIPWQGVLPETHGCLGSYVAIRAQAEEMLADVASVQSIVCRSPEQWGNETVHLLKMNALDVARTAMRMLIELEAIFGGSASADHRDHIEWMRREGYLQDEKSRLRPQAA